MQCLPHRSLYLFGKIRSARGILPSSAPSNQNSEFSRPMPILPFSSLGLLPSLLRVIDEMGYPAPTAIQAEAIPAILRGDDVLGAAQTGSGKTAAFALPILQSLLLGKGANKREKQRQVRALILVPTREL